MPRPNKTNLLYVLTGSAVGAALGGPRGALGGGVLGGLAGTERMPLEEALRTLLQARGMELVRLYRDSRYRSRVLYHDSQDRSWVLPLDVTERAQADTEMATVDDWLYEQAEARLRVGNGNQ